MQSKLATTIFVVLTIALTATCCTLLVIFLPSPETRSSSHSECIPRSYSYDSVVCICNASYCDDIEGPFTPSDGKALVYTATRDGKRFNREELTIVTGESVDSDFNFSVNPNRRFQKIKGFGGAFTDAAGINIHNLSSMAQEHLLRSYFSSEGIEYTIGRIPMASCDFSTRLYTYADTPDDFELKHFSLAMEDFNYKIPYMQQAKQLSTRGISFFGSPWSAPAWMKTNNNLTGKGSLIGSAGNKYHQTWALYFARFVEAYAEHGINIWGVTAQNEPNAGLVDFPFQCMGFNAEQQRDYVKIDLGPTLEQRGHGDVKIMVGDDQRIELPEWAEIVLSDQEAAKYVSGVGVHWYTDWLSDPIRLSQTHELFPNHFILATEACAGAMPWHNDVQLGNWVRGERYSLDILQDMNNWAVGWVDWNMALNLQGGPNWVENFVDSPIVVNAEKDEFYKQPTFYHLGHFSKFLPEGSTRIEVTGPDQQTGTLKYAGFLQPDGQTICFILLNQEELSVTIKIVVAEKRFLQVVVPGKSIQSFLWASS